MCFRLPSFASAFPNEAIYLLDRECADNNLAAENDEVIPKTSTQVLRSRFR